MTNINELMEEVSEPWKPRLVAAVNGFELKLARLDGEFPWHVHEAEDELFLCVEGSFRIEIEGAASVELKRGDVFVVPLGQRHRPVAREVAYALLLERAETKQYGG